MMDKNQNELRLIRILLTVIAIPVVVLIFRTLKAIFIPLVFAIFLSFVFAPLINWLRCKKVHTGLIMLLILIIISILMTATFMILTQATNSLITGFPRYQYNLVLRLQDFAKYIEDLGSRLAIATAAFPQIDVMKFLSPGGLSLSKTISNIMTATMGIGWNFILIIIFLIFIVAQDGKFAQRLTQSLDEKDRERTSQTICNIQSQIQKYLFTKTIISLCTAVVGMILMALYGVDFILVCGILLFALNFIPNIGSIIASAIPVLISFLQSGLDFRTITFGLLIVATQMLFGNILEPKIQGDRLNLSPIMVLVALIFWAWVWGVVGMVLAVPITSAINITLKQIDEKNLISAIISA